MYLKYPTEFEVEILNMKDKNMLGKKVCFF